MTFSKQEIFGPNDKRSVTDSSVKSSFHCITNIVTSGQIISFVEKSSRKKVEFVTTPVLAQHLTSPLYGPGQNCLEAQLQRRASYSGGGGGPPSQLQGLLMLPQQPQHNSEPPMFQRQAPFGMPAAPAVSATSAASINRKRQLSGAPVIINTAAPASVAVVAAAGSGEPAVTTSSAYQQILRSQTFHIQAQTLIHK